MQSVDQPIGNILLADQCLRMGKKYDAVGGCQNGLPHRSVVRIYDLCHLIAVAYIISRMYLSPKNSSTVRMYIA